MAMDYADYAATKEEVTVTKNKKMGTEGREGSKGVNFVFCLAFFAIFCSTLLWVVGVSHFGATGDP